MIFYLIFSMATIRAEAYGRLYYRIGATVYLITVIRLSAEWSKCQIPLKNLKI